MRILILPSFVVIIFGLSAQQAFADNTVTVDPKSIQFSPYRHKELPEPLLKRIRATTDAFEKIDGLTYEQAVDLYKRDLDPESNLVLWEEMVRAYKIFCKTRCTTMAEQKDVYRSLLLRSMFSEVETIKRSKLTSLTSDEARAAIKLYRLPPKPIDVIQGK